MNTATQNHRIASPYQIKKDVFNVNNKNHPVHEEVQKCLGSYDLAITFEEDADTIRMFENIPGLVAFLCTVRKGDKIIGQGRGSAVLNRMNRFVERTVRTAFNASVVDAIIRSTKILDAMHPDADTALQNMATGYELEGITEKQRSYLTELVHLNVTNEDERTQWESQMDQFTKEEASRAIQAFKK